MPGVDHFLELIKDGIVSAGHPEKGWGEDPSSLRLRGEPVQLARGEDLFHKGQRGIIDLNDSSPVP